MIVVSHWRTPLSPKLRLILLVVGLVGGYLAWDAAVVTDEEKIEAFAETISGELDLDRVDAAMHYVRPEIMPVTVNTPWGEKVYDASPDVRAAAHKGLSRFYGERLRITSEEIHVEEHAARLTVRVMTMRGFRDAEFRFAKPDDETWVLTHVTVR